MRILVVGHTSFVGRRLITRLAESHTIIRVGRDAKADISLDLSDGSHFPADIPKADVIIHTAASFAKDTIDGFLANELINSVGAIKVVELARRAECQQLIYLSSISCYNHPSNQYFSSYGLSKKHAQENLELLCRKFGLSLCCLELAQIYDEAGEARKHQPLLYSLVEDARQGREIILSGSVDPYRNFLYVEDVVDILERAVEQQLEGIFPTVHPQSQRLSEIAILAYTTHGRKPQVRFDDSKPDIPTVYIPQNFEIYDKIGYYPKTELSHGLQLIREQCVAT